MINSSKITAFKQRCLVWAYVLGNPRDGHTTTIQGGLPQSEAACLAVAPFGIRILGIAGLVANGDGTTAGRVLLEAIDTDPATVRLATIAAHQWQAKLIEQCAVTPAGPLQ